MDKQFKSKVINNKNLLVAITILTLVVLNIVQYLVFDHQGQNKGEQLDSSRIELINTYKKLDTISSQLEDRIAQIKKLGGNVDSLIEIKNQLEEDKRLLNNARESEKEEAERQFASIKKKLEGYEKIIALKDEEIAKKEVVAKELVTERKALLEKQDELADRLNRLEVEKNKLLEQMALAARMEIKGIRFFSINDRGIAEERVEFKYDKLDRLKVSVQIAKNELAKKGRKAVMMRIIEPEGASLYNTSSGTFKYKDKEVFYSSATEFYFDNKEQQVDFTYIKGNEYSKGPHRVEFFCEGNKIGEGTFSIK